MKIKITQPVMLAGKIVTAGKLVEIKDSVARELIAREVSVEYTEPVKKDGQGK
jgi:hypothetical protein